MLEELVRLKDMVTSLHTDIKSSDSRYIFVFEGGDVAGAGQTQGHSHLSTYDLTIILDHSRYCYTLL